MFFSFLSGRINIAWSYYFIPEEKTKENAVADCQQTDLYIHKDPGTSASTGLYSTLRCRKLPVSPGLTAGGAFHRRLSSCPELLLPTSEFFSTSFKRERDKEREATWES